MISSGDSIDTLNEPLLSRPGNDNQTEATKRRTKTGSSSKFTMFCIITAVVLERLAYYSLLGNLVIYTSTVLRWGATATLALTLTFTGFTWLSCLLGGYFGDVVFGRKNAITLGLIVYFIGFMFLPFLTWLVDNGLQDADNYDGDGTQPLYVIWFILALLLVSLGEGCFKSNMSPFGADQQSKYDKNGIENFFSYYYWAINLGSLVGFGPVVYLQDKRGFTYGYAVPAGLLLVALFFFMLPGNAGYIISKPAPKIMVKVYNIIKEAYGKKKERKIADLKRPTEYTGSGCFEDYVPIKHWLDRAMAKYGGNYLEIEVEEVKVLLKTLPFFGFLIIYCILYYQTNSTFVMQGMHMKINLRSFRVPVAWLSLTNIIFVLVFVPIIRNGLIPCLKNLNINLTNAGKIMIGMFIASLALVSAGVVENCRMDVPRSWNNSIGKVVVVGRDISILYQIPQFGLMGISEVFVMITGLEFAYCQAPKRMQSVVTGMFFIANGLGSMFGSLIFELISLADRNKFVYTDGESKKFIGPLKGELKY